MTEEEMLKDNWIIGPLEKDNIINDLKIIDMSICQNGLSKI